MSYFLSDDSPRKGSAVAFGRELAKAIGVRGIPRNELWRSTGIGRTALDNYRTGSVLPRSEAAAALASVLDWPKLREIVAAARTLACKRCKRAFTIEVGSGAKRYCSVACREIAAQEKIASTRARQAGQTGDGKRRYQEVARLRSGMRIAEEAAGELRAAIDAMCNDCEPGGACQTADCPLRAFSPLPLATHGTSTTRTGTEIRAASWTPARRERISAMTTALHRDGRIAYLPAGDARHPANDPARRETWIARQRAGHIGRKRGPLTPEHRAAIKAGHARRKESAA